MKRMPVFILGLSVLLIGCPSVHTMRSAEVLPSGQSENVVHVGQNGLLITAEATAEGETEGGSAAGVIPWAAYSYRAGLGNNLDFQVKVDMGLFPELGLGYQFVGTPGQGGTAVSAYVGTKYIGAGAGESQFSLVYAPVVLLADLPLGGSQVTVKGGFMVIKGRPTKVRKNPAAPPRRRPAPCECTRVKPARNPVSTCLHGVWCLMF